MREPLAWLNGKQLPFSAAAVSFSDAGFVLGATVTEHLRTFGGRLFRLDEHLARLDHSLAIVGIELGSRRDELAGVAIELATRNHGLLHSGDDLGLGIFVTPGAYPLLAEGVQTGPTIGVYTYRLPFHHWAEKYAHGQSLVTTDIEQVSARSWPRELKCRSRMHYFLADRQAAAKESGARAVLLDEDGFVTETTTANLVAYRTGEGIITPQGEKVLPGITLGAVAELAAGLSLPWHERDLTPSDIASADEAWITSTSSCLLPAVRFNGRPIGTGQPGPVFGQLIAAWNQLVGLDIVAQARQFSARG